MYCCCFLLPFSCLFHLPCFLGKQSTSVASSDPPQARYTTIFLPPPWTCRTILNMCIAECFCLPVVSSFFQDSAFSSWQALGVVIHFSPCFAAHSLTPPLLLSGACGTLPEASCWQSSAVLEDAAPQPLFKTG